MTEFYPLIAGYVDGLEENSERHVLYGRARENLLAELRAITPALSELQIHRERAAFDQAIRKVEAEQIRRQIELKTRRPEEAVKAPRGSGDSSVRGILPLRTYKVATREQRRKIDPTEAALRAIQEALGEGPLSPIDAARRAIEKALEPDEEESREKSDTERLLLEEEERREPEKENQPTGKRSVLGRLFSFGRTGAEYPTSKKKKTMDPTEAALSAIQEALNVRNEDDRLEEEAEQLREAEDRRRSAEAARLQREEEDRRRSAEAARLQREEEDRRRSAEAARLQREEEDRRRSAEAARLQREEEDRRRSAEAARLQREEEERRKLAEAARLQREEEERRRLAEVARLQREEDERREEERLRQQRYVLPPIDVIPEQAQKRAIAFTSSTFGPLDLLPDSFDQVIDPEQAELYARTRNQLVQLKEEIPSQERAQVNLVIDDFLDQPANWSDVKFKKILWLCGNSLRNALAQHDAVKDDFDPHYRKLPRIVAETLRKPVETWNIVALGDQTLRDLDAQRIGPQERQILKDQLVAARPILVAAAENRDITTSMAGAVIEASMAAAEVDADNIHARQRQELARGTSQNVIAQILRGAYRVAQDIQDPKSEEAKILVKEYKSGMYKKLGEWTITASVAGVASATTGIGAVVYVYGMPFFEFVVAQGPLLKAYLALAFQNSQIVQLVDVISALRNSFFSSPESK